MKDQEVYYWRFKGEKPYRMSYALQRGPLWKMSYEKYGNDAGECVYVDERDIEYIHNPQP